MLQGDDEKIQFEDDAHFEREYIEDIQQLLDLIEESGNTTEVMALLRNAYIIKIKTEDGNNSFAFPHAVYVDTSDEGMSECWIARIIKRTGRKNRSGTRKTSRGSCL